MQPMAPSGAPALFAAALIIFTVSIMQFLAAGCGLITMALPALREIMDFIHYRRWGFVEGMSAATTPIGDADFRDTLHFVFAENPTVFIFLAYSHVVWLPRRVFEFYPASCQTGLFGRHFCERLGMSGAVSCNSRTDIIQLF